MPKGLKRQRNDLFDDSMESSGSSDEESVNSASTSTNNSKVPGIPEWLPKATRKQLERVRNAEYADISIKTDGKHSQSTNYSRILLRVKGTDIKYTTAYVICDICSKIMSENGGHLKRHRIQCTTVSATVPSLNSSEVNEIPSSKSDFDTALVTYFAKTAKPLYYLEDPAFKELCISFAKLGQRFNGEITENMILKRGAARVMMSSLLDEKMCDIVEKVEPYFTNRSVSILADFGKLNRDFLSIKCGVLVTELDEEETPHWKLIIIPIAMEAVDMETKDAESIFDAILIAVQKFSPSAELDKLFFIADGGANIRRAGKEYFAEYIRCSAHATEIIGKRMLDPYHNEKATKKDLEVLAKYANLLAKTKELTATIKANKTVYKEFAVSLVSPGDTRWMTNFLCANSVYENLSKLIAQMSRMGSKAEQLLLDLSSVEYRKLFEELSKIYTPLKESNDFFQRNSTTISDVLPVYLGLLDDFEESASTTVSKEHTTLLNYASKAVKKQIVDLSDAHYVAFYLHPGYKSLQSLQERFRHHKIAFDVEDIVNNGLVKIDKIMNQNTIEPEPSTVSKPAQPSSDSFLIRRLRKTPPPSAQTLGEERANYDKDTSTSEPNYYWIEAQKRFPRLYSIALKIFSTPSSEADVERSFSSLKHVYSDSRRSLNLEFLQKMMIVKQFEQLN